MSIKGRNGRDPGIFQTMTIACAYCYAALGNQEAAHHLQDCFMNFWNAYEATLRQSGGKDDAYILDALRGSFGGTFLYGTCGYYMLGVDKEGLPIFDENGLAVCDEATQVRALGSLGKTCLQLGEIAYLNKFSQLTCPQLKMFVALLIDGEIDSLLQYSESKSNNNNNPSMEIKPPRRATLVAQQVLATARRASSTDKDLLEMARRRLSRGEASDGRASIYDTSQSALLPPEMLKELQDEEKDMD